MAQTLPQFPRFGELLRASDFEEAGALVAKLVADAGEDGVPLAGCPVGDVKIPSRFSTDLAMLAVRLDDAASISALGSNFEESEVQFAAEAYLNSFFMTGTMTWLCLFTGAKFPRSTKDGMSAYAHAPTKTAMMLLAVRKVQLLDLRVVLCGAWLTLYHLKIVSGDGLPPSALRPLEGTIPTSPADPGLSSLSKEDLMAIVLEERAALRVSDARAKACLDLAAEADARKAAIEAENARLEAFLAAQGSLPAAPPPPTSGGASVAADFVTALRSLFPGIGEHKEQSDVGEKSSRSDLEWACPKEIFLTIVQKWIVRGAFTDPHLLAPKHLDYLKVQPRTLKGYKKECDPFSHFYSHDLGSWIDGCAKLESMWSVTPGFENLEGTFSRLRAYLMDFDKMSEEAAISIVKRLMKDMPDPRLHNWKDRLCSDLKYSTLVVSLKSMCILLAVSATLHRRPTRFLTQSA